MNTIIASKKKAKELKERNQENKSQEFPQNSSESKESISLPRETNSNNDIANTINSAQDTLNSLDKLERCNKCYKYEKEIESLIYYKSEIERKYQEEKLKYRLLEKKYVTETSVSINELNSTISSLKQDILKKDVEINHLKSKALEYKSKYDRTLSHFEEDKNNFMVNQQRKNDIKNNELNYKIQNTNEQLISYAKENTELKSKILHYTDEKIILNEQVNKLKKENENLNNMLIKINQINNDLNCTKNMLSSEIEEYKRELSIIKENLDDKIKENDDNCKKNELLRQDSSKNLFIAVNKQQELIETEINFEKLKKENLKLKGIIDSLNNEINFIKNSKNINDLLLNKQINENKILAQENNELKQRILYMEQEYKKLENIPKKDSALENDLIKKNNILSNENLNHLDEINKLITQNEFLKNYYFRQEEQINKNKSMNDSLDGKLRGKNALINKINNSKDEAYNKQLKIDNENYLKEIEGHMKQKIELEKEIDDYKNIITKINQEKALLANKLLNKDLNENELKLRIQELENEQINNRKEIIKKSMENTDLEEQNIQVMASQDKLNKEIERKKKMAKSTTIANNSLKKLNDDNQRQIINLNSEIFVLEKKYKDKEEYIKELNDENSKQKNEILKLKKDNETLYKIIHKK